MRVEIVGLVALVGCFTKPQAPLLDGSITTDGTSGDGDVPCVSPVPSSTFDQMLGPCRPWGFASALEGATTIEANATLEITTPNNPTGAPYGGCTSGAAYDVAFTDTGLFVEVSSVIASGYTVFNVYAPAGQHGASMTVAGGLLKLFERPNGIERASVSYAPATMRWWRLCPDRAANRIVGEYSSNGTSWTFFAAVTNAVVPTLVILDFGAGVNVGAAGPALAQFRNLNVCQ